MKQKARRNVGFLSVFFSSAVNVFILVNTVISIAGFILFGIYCTAEDQCQIINYLALNPENILSGDYLWTIITHMFFHGSITHLLVNMFVLFSLGSLSERIIGRKRFIWFYIVSGIVAGVLSVILSGFFGYGFLENVFGARDVYMVGASGAIFGIAGLFVILLPKIRFTIIFFPFFSLPAYIMVPLVLVLTWVASIAGGLPIGNVAHFGGFLSGIVYGYFLKVKYRKKILMIQRYFR